MIAERSPSRSESPEFNRVRRTFPELIDLVASSGKFCPHFHLPLHPADDQVLAAMRRRYDSNFFSDLVTGFSHACPMRHRTDLIVGFQAKRLRTSSVTLTSSIAAFAYFHVFPYSVRTGTTAAKMSGKVAAAEITTRGRRMASLAERKAGNSTRFIGRKLQVLFEDRENDNAVKRIQPELHPPDRAG